jgi:8-oxo-dGTP diphosphatase
MDQHIGACMIVFNDRNQVLLGKRKGGYKAGFYGLPGGRIEPGERAKSAVMRELVEETGLRVDDCRYVGVVKEFQGEWDFIHFIFVGSVGGDTQPKNCEPEKCEGWEWYSVEELPENILPGHAAALELYKSHQPLADF